MENEETMAQKMPPLWRRERARGIEIGQELGAKQGAFSEAQSLLLRLGHKRLGQPGEEVQARIAAIQERERLEDLCERVLDVETWEELLEKR